MSVDVQVAAPIQSSPRPSPSVSRRALFGRILEIRNVPDPGRGGILGRTQALPGGDGVLRKHDRLLLIDVFLDHAVEVRTPDFRMDVDLALLKTDESVQLAEFTHLRLHPELPVDGDLQDVRCRLSGRPVRHRDHKICSIGGGRHACERQRDSQEFAVQASGRRQQGGVEKKIYATGAAMLF